MLVVGGIPPVEAFREVRVAGTAAVRWPQVLERHVSSSSAGLRQRLVAREDRQALFRLIRSQKAERRLVFRAQIIWFLAEEGLTEHQAATRLGTTEKTVRKWRDRFRRHGLKGLEDAPRSGRPNRYSTGQRCEVIAMACDNPQNYGYQGQERWTYDTLTEAVNRCAGISMSRSSVVRTLEAIDLKPHKTTMWLHSPDPDFKAKVNQIVDLYHADWPQDVVVLCVDEKTGMQANERRYETQRPLPGRRGRYEFEYIRHGTQALLASFDIHTGHVLARCGATRKAEDLMAFMEDVALHYHQARKVIVIWDNLNIHLDGPMKRWTRFNQRHGGRFVFYHTPLHASWVNQIEIFFSILSRRCLKRASFASTDELRNRVLAFIRRWNFEEGHPFNWTFRGYPLQSQEKAVG